MASRKRPFTGGGDDGDGSRQVKRWRPLVLDVLGERCMQQFLVQLEPVFRRAVREEIRILLANGVGGVPRQLINRNEETKYRLQFQNRPTRVLYTFSKVKAENEMPVKIEIIDTNLGKVVTSDPFWSKVEVQIVALPGDFGSDGEEKWDETQFSDHVIPAREGKCPLLKGKLVIKLSEGVGSIDDVTFTDNSSTTRTKTFRLGVRVHRKDLTRKRVREGVSEPFRVKERRVEANEKKHPPSLDDKVWSLEKIRKDGAFHRRLQCHNIETVQQFLQALEMDQEKLRSWLSDGKCRIPDNTWNAILKHARERDLDDNVYSYSVAGENAVLIFNSVYQLIAAEFHGCVHSIADLHPRQKALVEKWKRQAFEIPDDIKSPTTVAKISRPVALSDVTSVPGPSPSYESNLYFPAKPNGDTSFLAGPLREPYAQQNMPFCDQMQWEDASSQWRGHLLHQKAPLQEDNTSFFFYQNGELLVHSSPMPVPTENANCSPELMPADRQIPENPMIRPHCEQASSMGVHPLLGDGSTDLGWHHVQQYPLQQNEFDPNFDEHMYETYPSLEGGYMFHQEEANAMLREYLRPILLHKWFKLIAGIRCGISICKSFAARRTDFVLHTGI